MESSHHHFSKPPLPADDRRFQFELYTVPGGAGWFSWDNIHEIERTSLKEFFDGSSVSKNPRVYKEYRDFIISKFREDPSRRLTFSEVRKSLVGDVNCVLKVFLCLENWGLVNFGVELSSPVVIGDGGLVKVEEGAPHGVRVVAVPNSLKPVALVDVGRFSNGCLGESGFRMPLLSSHSDVYQELVGLICGSCKEICESGRYEFIKDGSSIICTKCYKNGAYGDNKCVDDYKFVDHTFTNGVRVAAWSEAETLLLLESVLKHGDDWDLVAQNVQTKSKLDCISKLIQLPFGHLMLGPSYNRRTSDHKQGHPTPKETKDTESQHLEIESNCQQNGDADIEGPPPKRICIVPNSDSSNRKTEQTDTEDEKETPLPAVTEEIVEKDSQISKLKNQKQLPNVGNSLMQQVAHVSAVVGPHVAAAAAEAAVTALCDENEIPKELFDGEENGNELPLSTQLSESERIAEGNCLEMYLRPSESENDFIPLSLRARATCATALGAAAAHAKLLAVKEDGEIEHLVSCIINTQLKKLQYKMGLLNELVVMMEKEFSQMVEVEDLLLSERTNVVQKVIDGGLSRWRDKTMVKSQEEIIL